MTLSLSLFNKGKAFSDREKTHPIFHILLGCSINGSFGSFLVESH